MAKQQKEIEKEQIATGFCRCGHNGFMHKDVTGPCNLAGCGCLMYDEKAEEPSSIEAGAAVALPVEAGLLPTAERGDQVGFVMTTQEVLPGTVSRALQDSRLDIRAVVWHTERVIDEARYAAGETAFLNSPVKSERLFQRTRYLDPSEVKEGPFKRDQLMFMWSKNSEEMRGGLFTAGTWFSLADWNVRLEMVRFEIRNASNAIIAPAVQDQTAPVDALKGYASTYERFYTERTRAYYDRILVIFDRKGI